jgi:two-component system NtrC family sensor kinase
MTLLPFQNVRTSLRTRILVLTGSVVVLLMLAISFILLFKWREIIIQKESANAVSVSKTFAVTVLDAMIFEETSEYRKEYILETYVENFISRMGNVKYVEIMDRSGIPIIRIAGDPSVDPLQVLEERPARNGIQEVAIYENTHCGWTLEVTQPLFFSRTYWGSARIGIDAQPIRSEISSVFFLLLSSTVVVTTIVLLILFISINRMTASIERLVKAIDSIDFSTDAPVDQHPQQDEIGYFYRHFSLLQERLESSKKALELAQEQIYHAEKLASIGRLASGVAHQVNNPLNGIKSCLYAIKRNPLDTQKSLEYLDLINEGIDNIETVVKKLLGFARQQPTSEQMININDSIRKVIGLFELRLKEKLIDIRLNLAGDLPSVRIDDHLFQEVIMNLLLNSYDAISRNGEIVIATTTFPDGMIAMSITDNGDGIAPDDLKKIFDPFFTTKAVGTGTGLGLSVCMGIIESHGGRIEVQSTPNIETTFTLTLPADYEEETAHH